MARLRFVLLLALTLTSLHAPVARADYFDTNNNGIPDFIDPTSATYWTTGMGSCNNSFGGDSGGGGGPPSRGEWAVIGGVSFVVISPLFLIVCDDPNVGDTTVSFDNDNFAVYMAKGIWHFGKWYSAQVWCGMKKSAVKSYDFIFQKHPKKDGDSQSSWQ